MIKNESNIGDENKDLLTVLKTDIIESEQLHQSELIQELQSFLFGISTENFQLTLQFIIDSIFVTSIERIEQLARNIFFAARFRSMKIELLSELVSKLILNSPQKNPLEKLPEILMSHFFTKAFHDEYSYKETWRFFFLYHLLKRNIYTEDDIINEIRKFYSKYAINKNEDQVGLFKIMCAWFAPEIEQKAPDLFSFFTTPEQNMEEKQSEKNSESHERENDETENGNITRENNIDDNILNFYKEEKNDNNNQNNQNSYRENDDFIHEGNKNVIENKKNDINFVNNISKKSLDDNDENKHEIIKNDNINTKIDENSDAISNENNYSADENNTDNENHDKNDKNDSEEDQEDNNFSDQYQPGNAFDNETDSESDTPLLIFHGNSENETRVFDVLRTQGYTLEVLRANNWSFYRECREAGYTIDPLVKYLLADDDDELQKLSSEPNFDIEVMIEPSLFSRSTILQDSTSPICFAAAVGSVKCFRFLLLNDANLEYETWNEHSTTIASFAVSGGSNEIVRLLNQKGKSFAEAIFVSVQYHRTDIFNWLFQLLNVDIEIKNIRYGTLLHRAAKSNNVELSLFCMEHRCDVNKPVVNNDFFIDDRTPPLSEAIQFQAIDVAKLLLSHKDSTLVPQIEKQDSLVFELIYAHNHEIMPLFIGHKTFENALLRVFLFLKFFMKFFF